MFARRRLAQHSTDATSVPDPDSTPVATPKERPLPLRISDWLFEPVHSSSLGAFRIILALNMLMQNVMFDDMFVNHQRSLTVFPYPGFGWVTAPTPTTGQARQFDRARLRGWISSLTPVFRVGILCSFY